MSYNRAVTVRERSSRARNHRLSFPLFLGALLFSLLSLGGPAPAAHVSADQIAAWITSEGGALTRDSSGNITKVDLTST